jgi:hypothetical protein
VGERGERGDSAARLGDEAKMKPPAAQGRARAVCERSAAPWADGGGRSVARPGRGRGRWQDAGERFGERAPAHRCPR